MNCAILTIFFYTSLHGYILPWHFSLCTSIPDIGDIMQLVSTVTPGFPNREHRAFFRAQRSLDEYICIYNYIYISYVYIYAYILYIYELCIYLYIYQIWAILRTGQLFNTSQHQITLFFTTPDNLSGLDNMPNHWPTDNRVHRYSGKCADLNAGIVHTHTRRKCLYVNEAFSSNQNIFQISLINDSD